MPRPCSTATAAFAAPSGSSSTSLTAAASNRNSASSSNASRVLASSLDYETTLSELARLVVPTFGDYCAVDVLCEDGRFARVDFVIVDPDRAELAEALRRYPPVMTVDSPAARALRSGEPIIVEEVTPELQNRSAQSAEHLEALQRLAPRSFMMVPLRARGRSLGLLTAGSVAARRYDDRDLALASDIAARAALALDNALLYRDAQDANRLKEDFLATLSHELRTPLNALLGWTHILKVSSLDEASANARSKHRAQRPRAGRADRRSPRCLPDRQRQAPAGHPALDLAVVVLAAIDAVRPAVPREGDRIHVSLAPVTGEVRGDPDRLQQVIWNLLSNAVKFTPRRDGSVSSSRKPAARCRSSSPTPAPGSIPRSCRMCSSASGRRIVRRHARREALAWVSRSSVTSWICTAGP